MNNRIVTSTVWAHSVALQRTAAARDFHVYCTHVPDTSRFRFSIIDVRRKWAWCYTKVLKFKGRDKIFVVIHNEFPIYEKLCFTKAAMTYVGENTKEC